MKRAGSLQASGDLGPNAGAEADLGSMVHDVVNSTAVIKLAASALRVGGELSEPNLAELERMEEAAAMVAQTVRAFASAARQSTLASRDDEVIDIYVACCALAEERRLRDGRVIYCRAFGDARGSWNRDEVVPVLSAMVDGMLSGLQPDARMTIAVTGLGRHVRVDVHGIGWLSPKKRQACLAAPAKVGGPAGALLTVAASRATGTIFSLRLPR
jgi:hypothetical protein